MSLPPREFESIIKLSPPARKGKFTMTLEDSHTQVPRLLTQEEKEAIVAFIPLNVAIPADVAEFDRKRLVDSYMSQLDSIRLYPSLIPEFARRVEKKFYECTLPPGTALGVVCAQSIGEKATQQTLNVFHKAGQIETMVVDAIPRFKELVNVVRHIKNPVTVLTVPGDTVEALGLDEVKRLSLSGLVHTTLDSLICSYTYEATFVPRRWHGLFEAVYGPCRTECRTETACIVFTINTKVLCETFTEPDTVRNSILQEFGDVDCLFSPDAGEFLVLVRKGPKYPDDLFEDFVRSTLVPLLKKTRVSGCTGITHVSFDRPSQNAGGPDPLVLTVEGGNMHDVIRFPLADATKTYTNNLVDVYTMLGIEATKNFLKDEFKKVLEGINQHHISLLTNFMTFSGTPISLTRFTMRKCTGVLTRASFEETMDNFTNSAVSGAKDDLSQVSASIIMGKTMNMGSGLCHLLQKIPEGTSLEGSMTF